jgi:hypothetical protein
MEDAKLPPPEIVEADNSTLDGTDGTNSSEEVVQAEADAEVKLETYEPPPRSSFLGILLSRDKTLVTILEDESGGGGEGGMDGTMEELRSEKLYARNNSINF